MFTWSPNGRELLVSTKEKITYRLLTNELNNEPQNVTATLAFIKTQWEKEQEEKERDALIGLKAELAEFIDKNFKVIAWSEDSTKVLYEASSSSKSASPMIIPAMINPPLTGASTQTQEREIKPGRLYVYDTKDDTNFFVKEVEANLPPPVWFPDSRHLVFIEEGQVKIIEYDGTNKTSVYSGPLVGNFVYPWPDGSKIVILTSLNPHGGVAPNLYTVNLK